MKIKIIKYLFIILILSIFVTSCTTKKGFLYSTNKISIGSKVAVVINSTDNLKNLVLATFLEEGYQVKAFNAADFYTVQDFFDIYGMKKFSKDISDEDISSMEKTYDNIYKLHIYNFELNKAEYLKKIRSEWGVNFLVLMDFRDWESVSWVRVVDLKTNEITFIENYPTKYTDNLKSIVKHFIKSISS